jgi:hypothetical protein
MSSSALSGVGLAVAVLAAALGLISGPRSSRILVFSAFFFALGGVYAAIASSHALAAVDPPELRRRLSSCLFAWCAGLIIGVLLRIGSEGALDFVAARRFDSPAVEDVVVRPLQPALPPALPPAREPQRQLLVPAPEEWET